jgi:hypothetical protein
MPKLTVEGAGTFGVPMGKRLVLALEDEAKIDQRHACGGTPGEFAKACTRFAPEPFEVDRDSISPVSRDYKGKGDFAYTGRIEKITFEAKPRPGELPPPIRPIPH